MGNVKKAKSITSDIELLSMIENSVGKENFRPGLDRIRPIFGPYIESISKSQVQVIIIGGTNGKGETSFFLRSLLHQYGKKTALWTSPHILSVRERIQINNKELSLLKWCQLIEQSDVLNKDLSFYEAIFLVFLQACTEEHHLDYLILEVGLGGRYDAVNLLSPDLCLLTSLSLDHQAILGNTLKKILYEKWGITRTGVSLISGIRQKFLRELMRVWSHNDGVPLIDLWQTGKNLSKDHFVQRNWNLAKEAFLTLEKSFSDSLSRTPPKEITKGRREEVTLGGQTFIFIGAHNFEGIKEMVTFLRDEKSHFDEVWLSFSERPLKDIRDCLKLLITVPCLWGKIRPMLFDHGRALKKEQWIEALKDLQFNGADLGLWNFKDGWNDSKEKKILVTGSYYFVGAVQQFLSLLRD